MLYVDANATFPVAGAHWDRVVALLKEVDGNPSSIHARGRAAKVALENARGAVAKMLGARGPEIVFTSGATEANNFALQGVVGKGRADGKIPSVVLSATEHASVLEPARVLEERGLCTVRLAPVSREGRVDPAALLALVDAETAFVAVMHANNEMGAVNPVRELAAAVKAKAPAAHVHVDAVQMFGKADLSWYAAAPIDTAAFSAHKIGGFKGVGALFMKPGMKLNLLIAGGGQERGRRPGTENMPGIVSFGLRCEELRGREATWTEGMRTLRAAWIEALLRIPDAVVHGPTDSANCLPNTVNFHVDGVAGDDMLLNLDLAGFQASSGSACSSGAARPSHVLLAMGWGEWVALNSVRISFADSGTLADVSRMGQVLWEAVTRVRKARA